MKPELWNGSGLPATIRGSLPWSSSVFVRSESRAFANKDEAVRSLTLFCQAHH
jgi:hypothetical protein